ALAWKRRPGASPDSDRGDCHEQSNNSSREPLTFHVDLTLVPPRSLGESIAGAADPGWIEEAVDLVADTPLLRDQTGHPACLSRVRRCCGPARASRQLARSPE